MLRFTFFFGFLLAVATSVLSVTVRITPLGDSLTGGPGCWRAYLWQKLQNAGVTNTDFVGTQSAGGCGFTFDGEHEGHGGFKATGIVADNQLPGWLSISQPDMVLMMLGTNDVWNSLQTSVIIDAFSTLVDQMRASKPTMRILVAQIPPMNPTGCTTCDWPGQVVRLNAAIAAWAPGKSTTASPITVVDCWTGFVYPADFTDGVHLSDTGTQKMATCWYEPVKAAILAYGGGPVSTVSLSTTVRTVTSSLVSLHTMTSSTRTTTTLRSTITSSLRTTSSTTRLVTATTILETQPGSGLYGQCGGISWSGPKTCASGKCVYVNDWYSQCLP